MQRLLIALGVLLVVAGLAWPWLSRLPWGRLPGDFSIEREGFSFHFPLMVVAQVGPRSLRACSPLKVIWLRVLSTPPAPRGRGWQINCCIPELPNRPGP
jgi:hypothetical protein